MLSKADEIKIDYKNRNELFDYIENYPGKRLILDIPVEHTDDFDIVEYKKMSKIADLVLCVYDVKAGRQCAAAGIKWYWGYPINSWYELDSIIAYEPCYIFLIAPLSMDLYKVSRKTNIPIRLCPNLAYDSYIPREDGICGQWIRPEDVDVYEDYAEVFDFWTTEPRKEVVLFKTYAEDKTWPGNLNLLIDNLHFDIDNRTISSELAAVRAVCGQKCMTGSSACELCINAFKYSANVRHRHYSSKRKEN